jgi:hypothetical protein
MVLAGTHQKLLPHAIVRLQEQGSTLKDIRLLTQLI